MLGQQTESENMDSPESVGTENTHLTPAKGAPHTKEVGAPFSDVCAIFYFVGCTHDSRHGVDIEQFTMLVAIF